MFQDFQLQLIKRALEDLGHAPVAEMLADRISNSQPRINATSSSPSLHSALTDSIASGDYESVLSALSGLQNDFHFFPSSAAIAPSNKSLAKYLTLRTTFLEMVVRNALGLAEESEILQDGLSFLQNEVTSAYNEIEFDKLAVVFPVVKSLHREQESSVLIPLALQPPSASELLTRVFRLDVLLVDLNLLSSVHSSSDADSRLLRIRLALSRLLHPLLSQKDLEDSPQAAYKPFMNIPPNYLEKVIRNATLYNLQNSLYYLPPRDDSYIAESLPVSLLYLVQIEESSKDSLPIHLLHTLWDHSNEVWFTRFSPLGRFLATGSLDGTCNVYDVQNNFSLIAELDANTEDQDSVFVGSSYKPALDNKRGIIYFCWEPFERYIVTCCLDTVIRVWDVENITQSRRLTRSMDDEKPASLICCFTLGESLRTWPCEFLPYKKSVTPHFIVGSPDKVLKVFTISGVEVLDFYSDADEWLTLLEDNNVQNSTTLTGAYHTEHATSDVSVSERAASRTRSPSNGTPDNGLLCPASAGQFNRINDFAITPNGRVLITANNDKQVFFYKIPDLFDPAATTSRIALLSLNGRLTSCTISSNGKYMLLSISPEELQLWDISPLDRFEKPFLKQKFLGQSQATYMVRSCFGYLNVANDREELILSGSDDGYIYIWRLETGQLITRVQGHEGLCNAVDWNRFYKPSGQGKDYGLLWSSVGDDKLVKIWGPLAL